jgi:hypothetical protein
MRKTPVARSPSENNQPPRDIDLTSHTRASACRSPAGMLRM